MTNHIRAAALAGASPIALAPERKDDDPAALGAEVKKGFEEFNRAWTEFKTKNDERLKQVEKKGEDAVTKAEVERLNTVLDGLKSDLADKIQKRVDEIEAKANRLALGGQGGGDVEAKHAAQFASERGVTLDVEGYRSYKSGLNAWMRKGDSVPLAERKDMSVGSDPNGGYTVTPDTSGRIVKKVFETSPMRQVASVTTIGTDRLEGFADLGEGTAGWVGETAPRTATGTPQLGKWDIPVHEIWAFPQVTQKLLDDSAWDIEGWLAEKTSDKFTRTENAAFLSGDGILKPRGLLTYPTAATADATRPWGTFQHIITGSDASFGTTTNGTDKLIDLVYSLKAAFRTGATFLMARSTVGAVRKLKDGHGNYVWQPSLNALSGGTLLGFGITEAEDMPVIAADSLSIGFGDFKDAYQIVDRIGIRVIRDVLTNKPYVGFYTTKRVGGAAVAFESVKFLKFGD